MQNEARRIKMKITGHIVESDDMVRHFLGPISAEERPGPGPTAEVPIYTTLAGTIPTGTVVEIVTTWEVVS